jgi:hypothetical protein
VSGKPVYAGQGTSVREQFVDSPTDPAVAAGSTSQQFTASDPEEMAK